MLKLTAAAIIIATSVAGLPWAASADGLDFSTSSTVHIEKSGYFSSRIINSRFITVDTFADHSAEPRFWLLTVTTNVELRTDQEPEDPGATVSVTVDDVSTGKPVRLPAFTDPGADGEILGRRYFSSTLPGCCAAPAIHHVRLLTNGAELFKSTGHGPAGISAWLAIPETDPTNMRWAVFDGDYSYEQYKKGMRGTIVYGDETGPLSSAVLMATTSEQSGKLEEWLPNAGHLLWIDPQEKVAQRSFAIANEGPASGTPDGMKDISSLKGVRDRAKVGGFQLALAIEGETLALIPIEGDGLDVDHATTADDVRLVKQAP